MFLTNLERKLFKLSLRRATIAWSTFPFGWNSGTKQLIRIKSAWKTIFYHLKSFATICYLIYMLYHGNPYTAKDLANIQGLVIIFSHLLMTFAAIYLALTWFLSRNILEEFVAISTELSTFSSPREGSGSTPRNLVGYNFPEKIWQILVVGMHICLIGCILVLLFTKGASFHVDVALLRPEHQTWATFLVSWAWLSYLGIEWMHAVMFAVSLGYVQGVTFNFTHFTFSHQILGWNST